MSDTITVPRTIFEQLESAIRRLAEKVEPTDQEARAAGKEAVALLRTVTGRADDAGRQLPYAAVHVQKAEHRGAQILLELAKKAEREGWEGPSDLAENHDKYAAEAAEEDLKRIHDYYH